MANVVIAIDELIRRTCPDMQIESATNAVRQGHIKAARIAVASGQLADMASVAEVRDNIIASRIATHPHIIGPIAVVGDTNAVILDLPGNTQRTAACGVAF